MKRSLPHEGHKKREDVKPSLSCFKLILTLDCALGQTAYDLILQEQVNDHNRQGGD